MTTTRVITPIIYNKRTQVIPYKTFQMKQFQGVLSKKIIVPTKVLGEQTAGLLLLEQSQNKNLRRKNQCVALNSFIKRVMFTMLHLNIFLLL